MPRKIIRAIALAALLSIAPAQAQISLEDDTGKVVQLPRTAKRIVSLAPHVTELLFAAGAGPQVVGVVAYSNFPAAAIKLQQVGGYSNVDMEAVAALKPDLVVAWKSGNRSANLDKLAALDIPVFMNEPRMLDDVARSLENFGRLAGSEAVANAAATEFRTRKLALEKKYGSRPKVPVFYQIWNRPLMTINGEHLISDVMRLCGGENVFSSLPQIAPTISIEGVLAANPEVVIASGMGEQRPDWLDQWRRWPSLSASAADNFYFIPPDLIQRHTPRLLDGAAMLCEFLETARSKRPHN